MAQASLHDVMRKIGNGVWSLNVEPLNCREALNDRNVWNWPERALAIGTTGTFGKTGTSPFTMEVK
jgi:hypothetical protein